LLRKAFSEAQPKHQRPALLTFLRHSEALFSNMATTEVLRRMGRGDITISGDG
jgi:hypothetical protein